MTEKITITVADGEPPLDPAFLWELEDSLREEDELDLGLEVRDRPPAPGEQGAIPFALDVIAPLTTLAVPFAKVLAEALREKIIKHGGAVKIKIVGDKGRSVVVSADNIIDMPRLISTVNEILAEKDESG